ncbi:MAG TPA: protein TolQ [Gammaproteobacteria bacterium]|nr:protein TolQ [Gammaproteobacteria bacterium]
MPTDMSLLHLVTGASLVVQIVMGMLLLASLASWSFIFQKSRMLKRAYRDSTAFEDRFWSGGNLRDLYNELQQSGRPLAAMERIFEAGFKEYMHSKVKSSPDRIVDAAHRVMRVTLSREIDSLETHLNFLATVGSTSPYVGLFGTVWGIMNSFRSLSNVQQATLSMVAPGIAEALVATAMGLFAAIPAVVAYNRFSAQVERLANRYENFMEEFSTLIQRQVSAKDDQ